MISIKCVRVSCLCHGRFSFFKCAIGLQDPVEWLTMKSCWLCYSPPLTLSLTSTCLQLPGALPQVHCVCSAHDTVRLHHVSGELNASWHRAMQQSHAISASVLQAMPAAARARALSGWCRSCYSATAVLIAECSMQLKISLSCWRDGLGADVLTLLHWRALCYSDVLHASKPSISASVIRGRQAQLWACTFMLYSRLNTIRAIGICKSRHVAGAAVAHTLQQLPRSLCKCHHNRSRHAHSLIGSRPRDPCHTCHARRMGSDPG